MRKGYGAGVWMNGGRHEREMEGTEYIIRIQHDAMRYSEWGKGANMQLRRVKRNINKNEQR
jgi:hypothetical protein